MMCLMISSSHGANPLSLILVGSEMNEMACSWKGLLKEDVWVNLKCMVGSGHRLYASSGPRFANVPQYGVDFEGRVGGYRPCSFRRVTPLWFAESGLLARAGHDGPAVRFVSGGCCLLRQ